MHLAHLAIGGVLFHTDALSLQNDGCSLDIIGAERPDQHEVVGNVRPVIAKRRRLSSFSCVAIRRPLEWRRRLERLRGPLSCRPGSGEWACRHLPTVLTTGGCDHSLLLDDIPCRGPVAPSDRLFKAYTYISAGASFGCY